VAQCHWLLECSRSPVANRWHYGAAGVGLVAWHHCPPWGLILSRLTVFQRLFDGISLLLPPVRGMACGMACQGIRGCSPQRVVLAACREASAAPAARVSGRLLPGRGGWQRRSSQPCQGLQTWPLQGRAGSMPCFKQQPIHGPCSERCNTPAHPVPDFKHCIANAARALHLVISCSRVHCIW